MPNEIENADLKEFQDSIIREIEAAIQAELTSHGSGEEIAPQK